MLHNKQLQSLFLCFLCALHCVEALLSTDASHIHRHLFTLYITANDDYNVKDPYHPSFRGGAISNLSDHVRYLDLSLKKSSGTALFDWINERSKDAKVTTAELLDQNTRFGVLSHGTQSDPIYNYGNKASLELFGYTIEELCRTPSRLSTVPELMKDRDRLIRDIETRGYGYIDDALRVKADGELFIIDRILVWTVFDEEDNRIGLAAVYDKENVKHCLEQS